MGKIWKICGFPASPAGGQPPQRLAPERRGQRAVAAVARAVGAVAARRWIWPAAVLGVDFIEHICPLQGI